MILTRPVIDDAQPGLFPAPKAAPVPDAEPSPAGPPADRYGADMPLWEEPETVHLTQYQSERLPDGVPDGPDNGNCGPTSSVMALRLVGLDVPGFQGEPTQRAIDGARLLGTGATDSSQWTSIEQNVRTLQRSGATVSRAASIDDALAAVREGKVAMLLGNNNADGYWSRQWQNPVRPANEWGGHFVVVSRHHPERDRYAVNDPALDHPVYVTRDDLAGFASAGTDVLMEQPAKLGASTINIPAIIVDGPGVKLRNAMTNSTTAYTVDPDPANDTEVAIQG